jgi:hypothetical protein
MNDKVSNFIKQYSDLGVVKDLKLANKTKDRHTFFDRLRIIQDHINATEVIRGNEDYWNECGCENCDMWKDHYENMLIPLYNRIEV